jgi:ketosteroid isomerase-like protein
MRRLLITAAIVLLPLGIMTAQEGAAGNASGPVAQALIDLENQWAKASKAGDGDALAPILANDFVQVDSDGSLRGKSEVMARMKGGKWTTNEVSDMKVMVHGDSAIVTGTWTGNGTTGEGRAINGKERFADTFVKMPDGTWQCVASASAPIK